MSSTCFATNENTGGIIAGSLHPNATGARMSERSNGARPLTDASSLTKARASSRQVCCSSVLNVAIFALN